MDKAIYFAYGCASIPWVTTIASRIRTLRKAAGLGQSELSAIVGVSQSLISDYENGTVPGADVMARIAQGVNSTMDYIVHGPLHMDAMEARLIGCFRAMSANLKQTTLSSAQAFAGMKTQDVAAQLAIAMKGTPAGDGLAPLKNGRKTKIAEPINALPISTRRHTARRRGTGT